MKIVSTLVLCSLMALGVGSVLTNPSEEQYAAYLSRTVTAETQVELCQPEGFSEWLGKLGEALSGACSELIAGGGKLSQADIQTMILENTEYKNRVVFSTYITETPLGNYRTIGAFGQFFMNQTDEGNQ